VRDLRFHGGEYEDVISPIMEAVCTSETSVYFKDTTRRYIPEGYSGTLDSFKDRFT
jgi:hypothetical protein